MPRSGPLGPIPDDWKIKKLSEVTSKIGSGATPRGGEETYLQERDRYALVRSQSVLDRFFDLSSLSFISDDQAHDLRNAEVRSGDVLLNITGDGITFSRSALVPDEALPACVNQHVAIIRPNTEDLLPGYLLAYLTHPEAKKYIEGFNSGGSRRAITKYHIENFEIPLPSVEHQAAISRALAAFDNKIAANRRMNGTLEAMAQATYRDWFVDFGPVRRKLAGIIDPVEIMGGLTRDPSEAASMAALFPHALDNERLPEGWRLIKIEQILDLIYGKSLPKTVRNNGNVPVYGSGGVGGFHNKSLVKGPGIIVGRKGTVGSLFWETEDFFPIDTAFYVAPKNNLPLHFVWQVLQTLGLEGMNTDAAVPGLNRNNVYRLETVWPGEKIVKTFGELITPIRARLDVNTAQNRTLAETRDYLLPRLMSGAVRVADVETEAL